MINFINFIWLLLIFVKNYLNFRSTHKIHQFSKFFIFWPKISIRYPSGTSRYAYFGRSEHKIICIIMRRNQICVQIFRSVRKLFRKIAKNTRKMFRYYIWTSSLNQKPRCYWRRTGVLTVVWKVLLSFLSSFGCSFGRMNGRWILRAFLCSEIQSIKAFWSVTQFQNELCESNCALVIEKIEIWMKWHDVT